MVALKKCSINYVIGLISIITVCIYLGMSIGFPPDPMLRSVDQHRKDITDNVYPLKGLNLKDKANESNFYGYLTAPIGDVFEYCKMALGKESYPPYQLRPLIPKLIGFTYKVLFPNAQTNPHDKLIKHEEYVRLTYISMGLNICFLMGICFLAYRLRPHHNTLSVLILSLTLINPAIIGYTSFFLLDIATLFIFALSAFAYFKDKLWLLVLVASTGIAVKETCIILLIPIFFLLLKKKSKNVLYLILPILVFLSIRYIYKTDLLSIQYSWNVSKGDIRLTYILESLGTPYLAIRSLCITLFSIGPVNTIAFLSFKKSKESIDFLTCTFLTISIFFASVMLASPASRTLLPIIPFLTFYAAHVLSNEKKEIDSENKAMSKA